MKKSKKHKKKTPTNTDLRERRKPPVGDTFDKIYRRVQTTPSMPNALSESVCTPSPLTEKPTSSI